jgi:NACalpha-BTF3-like transcription factor
MFEKRQLSKFPMGLALSLVEDNEVRLRKLIEFGVLEESENALVIENDYLKFFEEVLNVNEEISVLSVRDSINTLKENIGYFLIETNQTQKEGYRDKVRLELKKIGFRTLKNVVDLKRNVDNTYKQEPNFLIKKQKLQHIDEKSESILSMIKECEHLLDTEHAFFLMAKDPHMDSTCNHVRSNFYEAYHAIMEIQKQIVIYIDQIDLQNKLYKKIRKLKYLQDQLLIKSETNLTAVLEQVNPLWMEKNQRNRQRISLETLRENDQMFQLLRRIAKNNGVKQKARTEAGLLSVDDLQEHIVEQTEVNMNEVWNAFLASSYHLFEFILQYDYKTQRSVEQHVTLFCQLAILHPDECRLTGEYALYQNFEYPIIYAK